MNRRFEDLTPTERLAAIEFVNRLHQQYGDQIETILLFGSRARGEAEADSDMDILVVLSETTPKIRRGVRDLAVEVWLEHGIYVSTRVFSQTHWQELAEMQTMLYRNICRDGIDLLNSVTSPQQSTV